MKNWMKNGLLMLILPWLLAGCVLERFELPQDYAPNHPGAATPLANGAVFKGVADPKKGGEIFLRFVKTGPAQYVTEHFIAMPGGEDIVLPPAHARFVPLGGAHYALYWKRIGNEPKQGYALVRLDAGRLQVLEPMSQLSTLALAKAHGIAAQPPGLVGGYTFDTRDEARVLKFFKDLSVRKTEATLTLAATKQVPAALRTRTYAKLGEHIPHLTRADLGSAADAAAVAAWAQRLAREGDDHGHHLLARLSANGWGMPADGAAAIREAGTAQAVTADAQQALAQPDPAPVKKGCVEDWCKDALAFTDAHLSDLKLKMRKLRAELGKCPEVRNANLSCVSLDKAPPASRNADGSLRVVYFFAYTCPKCAALNPFMREWSDSRRVFVWRIHALMGSSPWAKNMVRTHYALKSLGAAEVVDKAMFEAARAKRLKFSGVEEFAAFAHANGLDAGRAKTAFVSGAAGDDLDNATHASREYKITGVPVLFFNGRYRIDIQKTDADTLRELAVLLDELVAQERLVER